MSSINVSRGGIFVDTDEDLSIGLPVVCNLPIGRDEEAMQLRGRVAWLRPKSSSAPNRPSGVGIEFVDLSDEESDKLSDIVGGDEEESHQLSLKLPGLASPVRGQAFLTHQSVFFRSKLPFLALESDVEFAFEDEDDDVIYDGRIVGVEVYNDPGSPVPRLQVEVAVAPETLPSTHDIPSGESEGHSYELLHIDAADTEPTLSGVDEMVANAMPVIEIPQMMPIVVAEVADVAAIQDELVVELTERVSPVARPFSKMWPPVALLVGCILGILAFALSGGDEPKTAPIPVNSALPLDDEQEATRKLIEKSEAATPSQEAKEAEAALERIRMEALSEQDELGDSYVEPVEEVPKQKQAEPKPAAAKNGPMETIGGVRITESEGELVIRLPIEGSLERAAHYLLADPPGLAINLPYAQPREGFHQTLSPHNEQLRSLWVRERLGGLHFRVFFDEKAESCKVKFTDTAAVVRCRF